MASKASKISVVGIILASVWWVLLMAIILFVPFLRVWWWIFFPLILVVELRKLYLWWIAWDYNYANKKWVMLEVVPPKVVLVPLKVMEDIYSVMWAVNYGPPNWRELWCEGVPPDSSGWMSWEMASIEGNLHFYIRVLASARSSLETALYGHYPELEISEVSDYTKNVPQNLPNKEWDTYGEDFILVKPAPYPIRTYEHFFEPQGEKIQAEEKRIDPMSALLELMSKMGTGEQYWLQFITMSGDEDEFKDEAKALIAKLLNRPVKKTKTFVDHIGEMAFNLVHGPIKEGSGEKASYKWLDSAEKPKEVVKEPALSQAEKEAVTEIENKLKRPIFRTVLRGVYVAKRENFQSGNRTLARAYFAHFSGLNILKFSKLTRPKNPYLYRASVVILRSRRQFFNYISRFTPLFPNRKGETALLNTEEMATLYHFPLKITGLVAPTMARVESKKGGPPPNLPTE